MPRRELTVDRLDQVDVHLIAATCWRDDIESAFRAHRGAFGSWYELSRPSFLERIRRLVRAGLATRSPVDGRLLPTRAGVEALRRAIDDHAASLLYMRFALAIVEARSSAVATTEAAGEAPRADEAPR